MSVYLPRRVEGSTIFNDIFQNGGRKNIYIIGGNGSGKSRLGIYLEESLKQTGNRVLRIAAQKVLSIPSETFVRSTDLIDNELFSNTNRLTNFQIGYNVNHVTSITNDFGQILSKLFSIKAKRDSEFVRAYTNNETVPHLEKTPVEYIEKIWKEVFPHRQIEFTDNSLKAWFYTDLPDGSISGYSYPANDMSDGERGALYILAHALCAPSNSFVIFDEPESHLHKSLLNRVWDKLEEYCPDKTIIAITHDLDLVASRRDVYKIWVKAFYGGSAWDWELIENNGPIPDSLFFEILGNRKKVLFVESQENKPDQAIFQEVYPDYFVIPCGSCEKVVQMTIALNENAFWQAYQSQGVAAKGLIDRDYRNDQDVLSLKNRNVEVLPVAEIENLLCLPQVIHIVCQHQGFPDVAPILDNILSRIILFLEQHLENDIFNRLKLELENRYKQLRSYNQAQFMGAFAPEFGNLDISQLAEQFRQELVTVLASRNFEAILKTFNNKGIIRQIDQSVNSNYKELVIRLITSNLIVKEAIIRTLRENLPQL